MKTYSRSFYRGVRKKVRRERRALLREDRERLCSLEGEALELRSGNRIAGRHVPVLQQRIHERSIFRQPVVQVRSGSQTARPDASDRLPLLNPDTGMNAGRKRRQVEVLRDVPGCMPDLDHAAVRRIRCDRDHSS